ncbi:hypothetical protein [Bacillus sp. EAC]|uniref:hypothetical protein n=1 Tax=Bacillus sp. EAC TaxID=1978338 RepID=UPI000B43FE70|nr:hypothetical protein [Bacillus sp. EAC]
MVIIISLITVVGRTYFPLFISVNVSKIEKFLLKNKQNPLYFFVYSTANNLNSEAEESYIKILIKYKNSSRQAIYKTAYAIYKKDTFGANANVHLIKQKEYRQYYQALIAILEGDMSKARLVADKINSIWMRETILAETYEKEGDIDKATEYAISALVKTRGVQRYSLYKNFEHLIERIDVGNELYVKVFRKNSHVS